MPQIVEQTRSRLFDDLQFALLPLFELGAQAWPELADYQRYLDQSINPWPVGKASQLRIVAQDTKPTCFNETYLARIYHSGEIQTRLRNWHDLFQVVSWRLFPNSKAALVERHYHAAKQRLASQYQHSKARRSAGENLLSLWDEGGVLLLSDRQELLEMVRQFAWRELFVQQRRHLVQHLKPLLFGHALMDKLRQPYIGMTGNAILLPVSSDMLAQDSAALYAQADRLLRPLLAGDNLQQPRDLQPFPLLGMPGWWPGNEHAAFYENQRYFRPGRGVVRGI